MNDPIPCIETGVPGRDGRDGLLLWVPYRQAFVIALKEALPTQHRYWDAGIGGWWIDGSDELRLSKIVLDHFQTLLVHAGAGDDDWVLHRVGRSGQNGHVRSITREVP